MNIANIVVLMVSFFEPSQNKEVSNEDQREGDVVEIKTPSNLKRVEILEVIAGEEE